MRYSRQTRMINLPYSRELSLLLVLERTSKGHLRINVFYNGEILVETLACQMGRPFSLATMTYATYQGVLYLCFGLNHPLYRFKIDEDALAKFNEEVNKVYEENPQESETGSSSSSSHSSDGDEGGDILGDSSEDPWEDTEGREETTAYFLHQQVVEQVKLDNPDILKRLFTFEAIKWPVITYTPQHLTEMLQVDAEQVNETLEKASEEEKDKDPLLLRAHVVAPFAGRLWGFGSPTNSHRIVASAKGNFADFDVAYPSLVHARNPLSPLVGTFVSETFDAVLWAVPFGEELLMGTTDGIYVLKEGQRDKGEFVKIHKELSLSVAPVKPVVLDKTLFFVEGNRKNVSCLTWSRERGGYQIHSLTAYADHLFTSSIVRLEAVRTPFNMLFALLGDGHFLVFTHDADLKILGWTQHYLGGDARIIDICALPTLKDDKVFFWCVRDHKDGVGTDPSVEYLEVLDTGQLSSRPLPVREAAYLDCASRLQDKAEIIIDRTVQSLIDNHGFFEELDMVPVGYRLLSQQLHHQIDRDAEQFNIADFLIDGVPWEVLAGGVFVPGKMVDDEERGQHFVPDNPVGDVANLLGDAPFVRGSYQDGLFVENHPIDGNFENPQFLEGKLVGADPLKRESKCFLEGYFKTARKAILKNIGQWAAFLEGLQKLIRFPETLSVQNFNVYTLLGRVGQLRKILEGIKDGQGDMFIPGYRDFIVTHKTKPYINFHSQRDTVRLKEAMVDEFNRILDLFLRCFQPFLDNIGLRNDFATIQSFVIHINKCFLEFMAGFEARQGDFFEQVAFLQDNSLSSPNFWRQAFRFDLTSRSIFATKEIIDWLKALTIEGSYKGTPFDDLDTERKVLFLKEELNNLLEEKEAYVKIRPQTQFVPRNMNLGFMDKTQIILDVCARLGLDIDFAIAAEVLSVTVKDGNITPALRRLRGSASRDSVDGSGSVGSDGQSSDEQGSQVSLSGSSGSDDEGSISADEILNKAIEGGDPEPVWEAGTEGRPPEAIQQDYNNLLLQLYTRMNTVKNYIERHYLLLSGQGNAEKHTHLWAEKNTFRFFKYCFLDLKNMRLYHDLFTTVSLDTYTDLVQADAGERTVFKIPALKSFPSDKLTLVAGNEFYEQPFTIKGDKIKLTQPLKAFSIGFTYSSYLKLFPLTFSEEADAMQKRNVTLGLKVANTKDGWVEEHQEDGSVVAHSIRSSVPAHNHVNYHASDRGYLVKEVAAILAPPYQSGWIDIPMKEAIKRDIDVTITVNTPAPFTLLKVTAKAQLLEHYKV